MRHMDTSRFWACDFWALLVILTCSCLLRTASGDPRTAVAGQFYGNNANHEKNLAREQRIDIVQGVAEGLSYRHKESKTRIIHRDRNASNIPFNPKIKDFLITLQRQPRTLIRLQYLRRSQSLYEDLMRAADNPNTDAYHFGLHVIEMVIQREHRNLKKVRSYYFANKIEEIVNMSIRTHNSKDLIKHVIGIGLSCIDSRITTRITMEQVKAQLREGPHN